MKLIVCMLGLVSLLGLTGCVLDEGRRHGRGGDYDRYEHGYDYDRHYSRGHDWDRR